MFRAALMIMLLLPAWPTNAADQAWVRMRTELIEQVEQGIRGTRYDTGVERLSPAVLSALRDVPRHEFVPESQQRWAYQNRPLPIGYGQTISQPYIVAIMTELLDPQRDDVILEVGTGSGYQAAVLAEIVRKLYTVEIVEPLARSGAATLVRLGYDNVTVKHADGYFGWPEHAPFDAIIVTAAGGRIPPPLVEQLKPGGKMILPVGGRFTAQYLVLVEKHTDGTITTQQLLPVQFVPLTRGG